jgi:DNA polymerase III delta prime subunit
MSKLPFVEKYRPINIDNIVEQNDVLNSIKGILAKKEMLNLLFHGPPGVGKTTIALSLAKHLYGDKYSEYTLELNASDERGIKMVRERIKTFAKLLCDSSVFPFKLIILDEADALTNDSQYALRRIIDDFSHSTRFIIICNYLNKLINPIISRFRTFQFKQISLSSANIILQKIIKKEKLIVTSEQINKIYEITGGDLRKMITQLQYNSIPNNKFLPIILENYKKPEIVLDRLLKENIQPEYLLMEVYEYAVENNHIELIQQLSNIDGNIQYGGQPMIQLMTLLQFIK